MRCVTGRFQIRFISSSLLDKKDQLRALLRCNYAWTNQVSALGGEPFRSQSSGESRYRGSVYSDFWSLRCKFLCMMLDLLHRFNNLQCVLFVAQQCGVDQPDGVCRSILGNWILTFQELKGVV